MKLVFKPSEFANIWSQIKYIWAIFTILKLWVAVGGWKFKLFNLEL